MVEVFRRREQTIGGGKIAFNQGEDLVEKVTFELGLNRSVNMRSIKEGGVVV